MFEKYAEDYYKGRIKQSEICKIENLYSHKLYEIMNQEGYKPYSKIFDEINTGIEELNQLLRIKYKNIVGRCNGNFGDRYGHYKGFDYITNIEWVKFCNNNKEKLINMWNMYLQKNKDLKYAISIDRINNNKGYIMGNLDFVTHGFNSWKRILIRPIKVIEIKTNKEYYFMSCIEGGRYFNIREKTLGEILNNTKYHNNDYVVKIITFDEVLKHKKCKNIKEYYNKFIL